MTKKEKQSIYHLANAIGMTDRYLEGFTKSTEVEYREANICAAVAWSQETKRRLAPFVDDLQEVVDGFEERLLEVLSQQEAKKI